MIEVLWVFAVVFFGIAIFGPNLSYYIKFFKPRYRVKTVLAHDGIENKYFAQFKKGRYIGWLTIGYDRIGDPDSGEFVFKLTAEKDSILGAYDTYENAEELCLTYRDHLRKLDEPNVEYTEIGNEK